MILLSYECKLKLQELVKAVKSAEQWQLDSHECDEVIDISVQLVKILPPEVTEGV